MQLLLIRYDTVLRQLHRQYRKPFCLLFHSNIYNILFIVMITYTVLLALIPFIRSQLTTQELEEENAQGVFVFNFFYRNFIQIIPQEI